MNKKSNAISTLLQSEIAEMVSCHETHLQADVAGAIVRIDCNMRKYEAYRKVYLIIPVLSFLSRRRVLPNVNPAPMVSIKRLIMRKKLRCNCITAFAKSLSEE